MQIPIYSSDKSVMLIPIEKRQTNLESDLEKPDGTCTETN